MNAPKINASVNSVIKASAPGTLMLMGEHAVLYGHKALAGAVDKRLAVAIRPREDDRVEIHSTLAEVGGSLQALPEHPKLGFVIDAIRRKAAQLPGGFDLHIHSEFSHQVGLGSSAAVTVALTAALGYWVSGKLDRGTVFSDALATLRSVQGRGSGTDLAASTYGGLVGYRIDPCQIIPYQALPPIGLYYSGYKTTTAEVIEIVSQRQQEMPALYAELYRLMHHTTEQAEEALRVADFVQLGRCMDFYQGLMDALGVNDRTLADLIYQLRGHAGILGAKISGSGLGDCVLTLGDALPELPGYERIPVSLSAQGVSVEHG